jgi:CubicO group peptidase (beta-lactamase class C family)
MRTRFIPILLAVITLSLPVNAQRATTHEAELVREFDRLMTGQFNAEGPGAAALVAKSGSVIYKKAFGMADLELNVEMQPDMIFRIGSLTKQFTAVAILQLVEKGVISLDDEITKYIDDYPTMGHKITIEHLLTHTSGIRSYTSMRSWDPVMRKRHMTPKALIDFFKNEPMDFDPGTAYRYNNSGYVLLGYIIEKVSGLSYADHITESIFKPAGMGNSFYDNTSTIIPNRAKGYQPGEGGIVNADYLSMTQPYAAGSIISTVEDLYKWNRALHSYSLIGKASIDKAYTSFKLNDGGETGYGYGWQLGNIRGTRAIEHGGGINGFLSYAVYLPDSDIFVAVLSNCNCNPPELVTARLAAAALGNPYPDEEIATDQALMNDYAGVYLNSEGLEREITYDGKSIYSQVRDSRRFRIVPYSTDKFMIENSLTLVHFERDTEGRIESVTSITRTGNPVSWKRTTQEASAPPKKITLETNILEQYAGEYELAPEFSFTITVVGKRIFAQGTGQGSNEIYPESETKFFYEVVNAQVEFLRDDSGLFNSLVLSQGGQRMEAKRIK